MNPVSTSKRDLPPTFTAVLLTVATTREPPPCPLTNERVRTCGIYTKEYCSPLKTGGVLAHTLMQINREHIVLSEVSQRKTKPSRYPLSAESKN